MYAFIYQPPLLCMHIFCLQYNFILSNGLYFAAIWTCSVVRYVRKVEKEWKKSSNRIYSNGFKLNNCNYRLFGNLNSQYHATYNICLESERKLCSIVIILLPLLLTPLSLLISIKNCGKKNYSFEVHNCKFSQNNLSFMAF